MNEDDAYVVDGPANSAAALQQLAWNDRTAAKICCNGPEGPLTTLLRTNSKVGSNVAISSNSLQSVWGRLCSMENGNQNWWSAQRFFELGDIMDDFTNFAELAQGSQHPPVLVIIEQHVLARTCILNILKRELIGFEIVEMATTSGLNWISGRDIRLIALNIGDKQITDPSIEECLAVLAESCPKASVAVLSNRDDDATASAAMQRGVRGFFPTSIPVEVAIAGLRLVLAGGVYRPLPIVGQNGGPSLKVISEYPEAPALSGIHEGNGVTKIVPERAMVDLTPREQHVLEALQLGLPNKLIAVRLKLSENTVKMHIQRIMRKCSAHNRTEAVLRWSRRPNGYALPSRVPSS